MYKTNLWLPRDKGPGEGINVKTGIDTYTLLLLLLLLNRFSRADSVQPHRGQATRLLCPWDSPGKNTGVGCHFLLYTYKPLNVKCMHACSSLSHVQLCNPMDCSPPSSSVYGILQARILVVVESLSHVQLFATPWTAAHQASLTFTISQRLLKLMSIE